MSVSASSTQADTSVKRSSARVSATALSSLPPWPCRVSPGATRSSYSSASVAGQRSASLAGPTEAKPTAARSWVATSTRCLLVGGLPIASAQRSRHCPSASSLVSSASTASGMSPVYPWRQQSTWMRVTSAASDSRAARTKSCVLTGPLSALGARPARRRPAG